MKHFNKYELEYIRKVYPIKGLDYCCKILNRTPKSISNKVSRLGLKFEYKNSNDEFEFLHDKTEEINLNESIIINSELITKESAYFMGFFWADGCCTKNVLRISITEDDANELKDIFNSIGKWGVYSVPKKDGRKRQICFRTTNKNLVDFFRNMGKYPNSDDSHEKILNHIPEEYKLYFIRGLFDGDGCYYFNQKRKICGHEVSLSSRITQDWEFLVSFFSTIGVNFYTKRFSLKNRKSEASLIRISKTNEIKMLIDYLYTDNDSIFLNRKYLKAMLIKNN